MQTALPPRALLGTSAAILELQADTRLAEQSDAQVLITGEPGVGKRALALLIHSRSHRRAGPFAAVDCRGTTDAELGRTLFGLDGQLPGANRRESGLLHAARRGTLFINGVDEITPHMQTRLSRVLEAEDILSSGAEDEWDAFDVRIIVGAPPHLFDSVESGKFREELFYRLNVIHLIVPPLRERIDDMPAHLRDCLRAYAESSGLAPPELSGEAVEELKSYSWPRNDSEVEYLARLLVKRGSKTITSRDLPPEYTQP